MELKFYYKEKYPEYEMYKELINKMEKMSDNFYSLDKVFYSKYNYSLMKKYQNSKIAVINEMFKEIISYFPNLNNNACAIYLNGSYARGNITSGSDIDLTFYFKKKDISKYQTTIYLIRYAISVMLRVNIVHVHSFTKNFITEYRKDNNLVIKDPELETKIFWTSTNNCLDISYPKNQMIAEREICEISSLKDFKSLTTLYKNQLKKLHPKEWIYTHECIHITDNSFSADKLIKKLDTMYNKKERIGALNNIRREIQELIEITENYYDELKKSDKIELASYNMIGKRKVTMLVHSFATYLRWYYIDSNLKNIPTTLNLDILFNYETSLIDKKAIDRINKSYYYFRYVISKVEIWAKKYDHHYEHRSDEIIKKNIMISEYKKLWKVDCDPIKKQIKSYSRLMTNIKHALQIINRHLNMNHI